MEEISKQQIDEYVKYFPGAQISMVLASVIEGNTEAQFWYAPQPDHNGVYLLWDKGNNVFYLSGQLASSETIKDLASLINGYVKEKAIKEGLSYFKLKTFSSSLENSITDIFKNIQLHKTSKVFYTFHAKRVKAYPIPGLEGIQYHLIDADFLEEDQFENNHHVKSEVEWMWPSLERFRAKGFGVVAVSGASILCWCTAEYVSENKCGIGIEVIEEFQNKGIATATVTHFLEHCLNQNVVPHWECDKENVGSVRVAEKVGFEKTEETIFWWGQFIR
ncbi:MAG TPA: GNAT family N-acetyltransferase [Anaerolineales bacterium]|nr:GNAT family N-acetyltransferase [Anaerolineales bacterium]